VGYNLVDLMLKAANKMIFCPNCGANIDSKFLFCGKCGKMLKPDNELIIDGNKNNKLKHFLNKNISSFKRSALFFILWVLVLPLAIMIIFNRFNVSVSLCERLPETINQISHKIKYVKEGLSISYLSREITFIFDYILNIIYIVGSIFLFLFALFYVWYFGCHTYLNKKLKDNYHCNKPLCLNKVCIIISKTLSIVSIVFFSMIVLILILKYTVGVL